MQTLIAAVVLAWIVLVVLAFGFAGMLRQLRDVQATLRGHQTPLVRHRELPERLRPSGAARYLLVLLVDDKCPVCEEVTPIFAGLAGAAPPEFDFAVLGYAPGKAGPDGIRRVVDEVAFHVVDPGWRPAVALVDATGAIVGAEPAGSPEAVRAAVELFVGTRLVVS